MPHDGELRTARRNKGLYAIPVGGVASVHVPRVKMVARSREH